MRRKSTWVTTRLIGWRCRSRTMVSCGSPPTFSVIERVLAGRAGERDAQVAAHDGDALGAGALPVDHAGDLVLVTEAARRGRAGLAAEVGSEGDFGRRAWRAPRAVVRGNEPVYGLADPTCQPGRSGLVLAAEDLADAGVVEHGVERVGDDPGDRQHLDLVDLLLGRQRQACW